MNVHFEANRIKEIFKNADEDKITEELCNLIRDVHKKGKYVGYEIAVKEIKSKIDEVSETFEKSF